MCFLALGLCGRVWMSRDMFSLLFMTKDLINETTTPVCAWMSKNNDIQKTRRGNFRVKKLFNLKNWTKKLFVLFPAVSCRERILIWNGESTWEKCFCERHWNLKFSFIWLFHELHKKIVFEDFFLFSPILFLLYIREWNLFFYFFYYLLFNTKIII
jgi:hypothetical protein